MECKFRLKKEEPLRVFEVKFRFAQLRAVALLLTCCSSSAAAFLFPGLQTVINRFVKIQAENGYVVADDFYLLDDDDSEEAEDIEVPKSLGDIFESVAGAIFLDSKLSLVINLGTLVPFSIIAWR